MTIKLKHDVPVAKHHGMVAGRELEVLRVSVVSLGYEQQNDGYWVQGRGEEVKIFNRECDVLTETKEGDK